MDTIEDLKTGLAEYLAKTSKLANAYGETPKPEALKPDSKASAKEKVEAEAEYTEALLAKRNTQLTAGEYADLCESLRAFLRGDQ